MNPIGAVNALYPMPITLVGATVNDKPNFLMVAHVGILNHGTPQYLSIGLGKVHYTNAGISWNRSFSICMPSAIKESCFPIVVAEASRHDMSLLWQ